MILAKRAPYKRGKSPGRTTPLPTKPRAVKTRAPARRSKY